MAELRIGRVPARERLELREGDPAARRDRVSDERVFVRPPASVLRVTLGERRDALLEPRRKVVLRGELSHHEVRQLVL